MKTLVKSLAHSLIAEPDEEPASPPSVYTTAICTEADLVTCLSGVARISRDLGFTEHPETLYRPDGRSAMYHVDHPSRGVALVVECHPGRRTVSLAVTGLDDDATHASFRDLERALFGDC